LKNYPQIILSDGEYKNNPVVFIEFDFNWSLVDKVRKFEGTNYIAENGVPEMRKLSFLRRLKIHKIFGK